MIVIGLTGGIGSGKSTAAEVWRDCGCYVLKADDLAKDLMVSYQPLITRIRNTFGDQSYHADGSLNRAHLSKEAFKAGRVEELNALVHPVVKEETIRKIHEEQTKGTSCFVYEAALLLTNGPPDFADVIVVVSSPEEKRIQRVMKRDDTPEESVRQRMDRQMSQQKMESYADKIIENNGTLAELEHQARELLNELKSKS